MGQPIDVLTIQALRALTGIDCTTPRCGSFASGTGRLVCHTLDRHRIWQVEYHCAGCGATTEHGSHSVDELVALIDRTGHDEREETVAQWLAERTKSCKPL
jgi:hypothetical protein